MKGLVKIDLLIEAINKKVYDLEKYIDEQLVIINPVVDNKQSKGLSEAIRLNMEEGVELSVKHQQELQLLQQDHIDKVISGEVSLEVLDEELLGKMINFNLEELSELLLTKQDFIIKNGSEEVK